MCAVSIITSCFPNIVNTSLWKSYTFFELDRQWVGYYKDVLACDRNQSHVWNWLCNCDVSEKNNSQSMYSFNIEDCV